MKLFARFDETGVCVGYITSNDPHHKQNPAYEEITDFAEKQLIQRAKCKKIIDEYGTRRIVLFETVE